MNDVTGLASVLKELKEFRKYSEQAFTDFKNELNDVKAKMAELEVNVKDVKQDVEDVRGQQEIQRQDIDVIQEELVCTTERIKLCEDSVEKLERYSRRENLLLYGIPENRDDNAAACKDAVLDLFSEIMPENVWSKRDIVRAHRVGAKQSSAQRPIIVRLHHHDDKLAVLEKRIALKEKGIGVANDLTYNQRRQLRELREQGQRGYFKNGQLVIEETPTTPATYVDAGKQKPSPRSSPEAGRRAGPREADISV
ncbi:SH3 domain protein [Elysia marginata]|uniref:SH3 domain protein n=1 Tax=Elysia marginata TaxID=1093978 RepID=A0AAV4IIP1_9GAST|nr:SH3 domain protein [Elysia marginata]